MGLRERLNALVANPRIQYAGRDLDFAKSLLAYYERTGRLTSGRRTWVDRLEARYAEDAPDNGDAAVAARIEAVMARTDEGSWDQNFLGSVLQQNRERGQLSARQLEILAKIEDRYSQASIDRKAAWAGCYTDEMADKMRVAAAYYAANPPYYGDLARQVLSDPNFVPTERQFRAMVENKYAAKVITAHFAEPAFPVGSKVMGRANAPFGIKGKMGFVMKTDAKPVTNAARGTKVYMVLPVGEPTPIYCEERHLKRGRF
tara:strand:- start:40 stop:816 length:777 start_codon:yes stop_codon:yes gene_type:complete